MKKFEPFSKPMMDETDTLKSHRIFTTKGDVKTAVEVKFSATDRIYEFFSSLRRGMIPHQTKILHLEMIMEAKYRALFQRIAERSYITKSWRIPAWFNTLSLKIEKIAPALMIHK